MKKKIYLAYGSNMDIAQMRQRCPDAKIFGIGWLTGWRLMFKGSLTGSYATIERGGKEAKVPLVVWKISEADERALNRYEGFPAFYYKRTIKFDLKEQHTGITRVSRGMAYVMHEYRDFGIPSKQYLDLLLNAYKTFGFQTQLLLEAWSYSKDASRKNIVNSGSLDEKREVYINY